LKNSIKILFWAVFFITAFVGCSESPGNMGNDLIKDDFGQDVVVVKTFSTHNTPVDQNSKVISGPDSVATGAWGKVLIGKMENVNSKFLVKFNTTLPDSVFTPYKDGDITVLSAKLEIVPNIVIGKESLNGYRFEAFKLSEKIKTKFTKKDPINYTGNNLVSNFSLTDTLITADFDKNIITEWLKEKNGDSTANYGAVFKPSGSNNNIVRVSTRINGKTKYDLKISFIVKNKGSWVDTLFFFPQGAINITDGTMPNYASDELAIQGGVPSRANYWFNKDQLPKKIAVNNATLEFFINKESSLLRKKGQDTLELSFYTNAAKDTLDFGRGTTYLVKEKDKNSFKGDATQFIQRMLENNYKYGFRIRARSENINVSKIVLKNHLVSDPALKPKLTIKYSQKNK